MRGWWAVFIWRTSIQSPQVCPLDQCLRSLHNEHKAILINGRHNRAAGFNADLEKYLEAQLAGWRVFRFGPDQITMENVVRLVRTLSEDSPISSTCPVA